MDLIVPFRSLLSSLPARWLVFCHWLMEKPLNANRCIILMGSILAINTVSPDCGWADVADPCAAVSQTNSRWPSCEASTTTQKISFVHIADMHAHYNPDQAGSSPAGRIRGFYEQVKKENPFTIFTDAGDDYEKGSIAEELSQGRSTREVVKAMRYDVRTLGNHDFAWGIDELLQFSHDPSAVVLGTNTKMDLETARALPDRSPGWTDFAVLTVGCVRIGFLGLLSRPWDEKDRQYDGPFYSELPALQTDFQFVEAARAVIARHRQEVDVLVLVSHLGLEDDILLAQQTNGIDLILGGHTHATMTAPLRVKDTSIVHVGAFAEYIGRFDLEYDLRNKRIAASHFVLVDNRQGEIATDEYTEGNLRRILQKYAPELAETITDVTLDQDKQEMALIAARAAVEALQTDAAFVSAATVRKEWRQGGLTQQDILDAFTVEREPAGSPGFSSFYLVDVRGEDLLHATAVLADFAYWGPAKIDPAALYTIAIQKTQAFHQQEFFGRTVGILPPKPAAELWETVVDFARGRKLAGLPLDDGAQELQGNNLIALLQGKGNGTELPTKQIPHENF